MKSSLAKVRWAWMPVLVAVQCSGQSNSLSLAPAAPGASILNLNYTAGTAPASALEWKLSYPSTALTGLGIAAGPALTAVGKSLTCTGGAGAYTCVASGMTNTSIGSGVAAVVTPAMPPSFAGATISIGGPGGSTGSGDATTVTGTGVTIPGPVSIQPALSSLTCSTSFTNSGGGTVLCSVKLAGGAPAPGVTVTLASNHPALTVAGSVTIAAGSSSAPFSGKVVPQTVPGSATVTATAAGVSKSASIPLAPGQPALSSLACAKTVMTGAGTVLCTVTLAAKAAAPGVAVSLASSHPAVTTPASATVAAGSATATFNATVAPLTAAGTAVITATAAGVSKTASIVLASPQPALSSVGCAPATMTGAGTVLCTVTLAGAASAQGVPVTLASNHAKVTVPGSATVAAGSASVTFTATVAAYTSPGTAVITATSAGVSKTASLALTRPQPALSSVGCAKTTVNGAGTLTCTVTLAGTASTPGVPVTLASNNAKVTVPASVTVAAGSSTATFTANVDAFTSSCTVAITATAAGTSKTFSLALSTAIVISLNCTPSEIRSGGLSTCAIGLSRPVQASYTIAVTSSNSLVSVPSQIVIPANGSSATFGATAGTIAAAGTAVITVRNTAGPTASFTLNLRAPAGSKAAGPTISRDTAMPAAKDFGVSLDAYLGGHDREQVSDIATDAAGNTYLAGGAESASAGSVDAFVTKLSPSGTVIWSTPLGGAGYDRAYAVEVDDAGNVYLAGRAGRDFPVKNAFQPVFSGRSTGLAYGEQNAFAAKLSPAGAVLWASYVGTAEAIRDLAIDGNGDIYLASDYRPSLGQAPMGNAEWFQSAFQKTPRGGHDLLILKVAGDGSGVLWASYLGGSGDEDANASIRVDPSGSLLILTGTTSTDMPVPNGYQTLHRGGSDAYLARMTPDGSELLWATYFGGSGTEVNGAHLLAVDAAGNAYLAMGTNSSDAPTTAGSYQRTCGGAGDTLAAKFSPSGALLAATCVGGAAGGPQGVAVDGSGEVHFPVSGDAAAVKPTPR